VIDGKRKRRERGTDSLSGVVELGMPLGEVLNGRMETTEAAENIVRGGTAG
jgi:hypothetical protein